MYYKSEVERLQAQDNSLFEETVSLKSSLDRARLDVTRKSDSHRQLTEDIAHLSRELSTKSEDLETTRNQLSDVTRVQKEKM